MFLKGNKIKSILYFLIVLSVLGSFKDKNNDSDPLSPSSATCYFKTGFENGVSIGTLKDNMWQSLQGPGDAGYPTPFKLWGTEFKFQNIIMNKDGGFGGKQVSDITPYYKCEIQNVNGHSASPTRALYLWKNKTSSSNYTNIGLINDDTQETSDVYFSYWVKLQDDLVTDMTGPNGRGWRTMFGLKTPGNTMIDRVEAYIYYTTKDGLYWHIHGDSPVGKYQWEIDKKSIPVPVGEWFMVEFFCHHSEGPDGWVWWAINGQTICDQKGKNSYNGKKWDRIKPISVYGGEYSPNGDYGWWDDLEVWDGWPAGPGVSRYVP